VFDQILVSPGTLPDSSSFSAMRYRCVLACESGAPAPRLPMRSNSTDECWYIS
jgi:hypothetical protein